MAVRYDQIMREESAMPRMHTELTDPDPAPQDLYERWVCAMESAGMHTYKHWDELTLDQQARWIKIVQETRA